MTKFSWRINVRSSQAYSSVMGEIGLRFSHDLSAQGLWNKLPTVFLSLGTEPRLSLVKLMLLQSLSIASLDILNVIVFFLYHCWQKFLFLSFSSLQLTLAALPGFKGPIHNPNIMSGLDNPC